MAMSAIEFAQMRHAVHWITAIYSNVFFFVLGLPILLVRRPSFAIARGPYRSPLQRVKDWWHLMNDRSRRREYILKSEAHAYNWFAIVMTVLFCVGWGFKTTAASLTFDDARKVKGTALDQAAAYLLAVFDWNNGKWWLGALATHLLQYLMHVYHLMMCIADENEKYREDAIVHIPMYAAAHLGVFNFAINAPGLFIPNVLPSNIIVVLLNIVAISVFAFLVFAVEPLIKAWGCYPVWYNYDQYDFGMCPAYLSQHNPEVALAPVCTAVDGSVCDTEVLRWSDIMHHAWSVSTIVLSISFVVYVFSIPAKVEYYNVKYREALAITERTRSV